MSRITLLLLVTLVSASATAQQVRDSSISGTLVSRSATIPQGSIRSNDLYTVPTGSHFVLTQACLDVRFSALILPASVGGNRILASGLGGIPLSTSGCTSYAPGIALTSGEALVCELGSSADADTICLITGVLQPQNRVGAR